MFYWKKHLTPFKLLLLFVLINLLLGLLLFKDFGYSQDERREGMRAEMALRAYSFDKSVNYNKIGLAQYYGTGQSVFFQLAENAFGSKLGAPPRAVAHYCYYISFQLGVLAFFTIAKRFMNDWTALVVALLFATQPLYFGHAFINAKDIPLMSSFLWTLSAGFSMVEECLSWPAKPAGTHISELISRDWQVFRTKRKIVLVIFNVMLAALVFFNGPIKAALNKVLEAIYHSPWHTIWGPAFARLVEHLNQNPLEAYSAKLCTLYDLYVPWIVFGLVAVQVVFIILPNTAKALFSLRLFSEKPLSEIMQALKNPRILLAAGLWGLCLATRMIGVAAGGLIGFYFLLKGRKRAVIPLLVYTVLSGVILFLMWPYLWYTGWQGLIKGLTILGDFPVSLRILYDGKFYTGKSGLPIMYIPKLMMLQFTEPVVILTAAGAIIGFVLFFKSQKYRWGLLMLYFWFFIPIIYVIAARTVLYHNFRQLLFITPPLFIFAGWTIERVFYLIRYSWAKMVFVCLILLPGLISIVQLHPFEYIYYNQFIGGVEGAYRRYDLDYWMTSIKQATEYANDHLPPDTTLNGWYAGINVIKLYLRPDIELVSHREFYGEQGPGFHYVMLPSRLNYDTEHYTYGEVIYQIRVKGATLMVIKQVK